MKVVLASIPLTQAPNFTCQVLVQTIDTTYSSSAVLDQKDEPSEEDLILYLSKKYLPKVSIYLPEK